jgi:hypothetical protein
MAINSAMPIFTKATPPISIKGGPTPITKTPITSSPAYRRSRQPQNCQRPSLLVWVVLGLLGLIFLGQVEGL